MWIAKVRQLRQKIIGFFKSPRFIKVALISVGAVVLVNLVLMAIFWHQTYPGTMVAYQTVGRVPYTHLNERLNKLALLPSVVTLQTPTKAQTIKVTDLGVAVDQGAVAKNLTQQKAWLPMINIVKPPRVTLQLRTNDTVFHQKLTQLVSELQQAPVDATITNSNGNFSLQTEKTGQQITTEKLRSSLLTQLQKSSAMVHLSAQTLSPKVKKAQLLATLQKLQTQQKTVIKYHYQTKLAQPSAQEVGGWFVAQDTSYVPATDNIQAYIVKTGTSFGIQVQNLAAAVKATADGLQANTAVDVTLVAVPKASKSYSYCVAAKGVDSSLLPDLKTKLQAVYHDARGWDLDGQVNFSEATSGCNLTVWLSAADQMGSFGSICDELWSCTVSPNVIINVDRWQGASAAWNQSGGNLDDYRSMVINHETGHWFGFGHQNCGGVGQLAPVMQQQSIDLQGCRFNPWPLPSELAALKLKLGL